MCGIAGEVSCHGPISAEAVQQITAALKHRGPDGEGIFRSPDGQVVLGHRRLAIIDLSSAGNQPMLSPDGRVAIVFNGEVYNYIELRRRLEQAGYRFSSKSDTEVILAGYITWGMEAIVRQLRGMFAFAIADVDRRRVYLVRDPVGIKPLFVQRLTRGVRFSSEVDPLRSTAGKGQIDVDAVADFLTQRFVSRGRTIWRDVREVLPGTYLEVDYGNHTEAVHSYWNIERLLEEQTELPLSRAAELFDQELRELVNQYVRSDVPIALLLSGGVDSGVLAGLLSRNGLAESVTAYTISFGGRDDEGIAAGMLARRLGYRHVIATLDATTLASSVEMIGRVYGQPMGDSSAVPYLALCREVARHEKVAFGGDGGDELFGGYKWYRAYELMKLVDRVAVSKVPASLESKQRFPRIGRLVSAARESGLTRFEILRGRGFDDEEVRQLLDKAVAISRPSFAEHEAHRAMRVYDLLTFTSQAIIPKVDIASMHFGLEVRVPFLDHRLLEAALMLPRAALYNSREGKLLLRTLARDHIRVNLSKGSKRGFGAPLRRWVNALERLASEHLLDGALENVLGVPRQGLLRTIEQHSERREVKLWLLLALEMWLRPRLHQLSAC